MAPNPADSGGADDSETITGEPFIMRIEAPAIGLDVDRIHALIVAIEALVIAGMSSQASPLCGELRGMVEAARGPRAGVIDLRNERSKRQG